MSKEKRIGAEENAPQMQNIMEKIRLDYDFSQDDRSRMVGDLFEDADTRHLEIRWDESVEPKDKTVFSCMVHEFGVITRGRVKMTNTRIGGDIAMHYDGPRQDVLAALGQVTNFVFIQETPKAQELDKAS